MPLHPRTCNHLSMESKFTLHFLFIFTFFLFQITLPGQGTSTSDCQGLSISAEVTPACIAGSNGQLKLVIEQGLPPYRVKWDDGSTKVIRKVSAGSYQVQITDALGCHGVGTFKVPSYSPIQVSIQVNHTSKPGKSNGAITLHITGGQPPYYYSWISSDPSAVSGVSPDVNQLRKLPSGKYKIVVFDAARCYKEIETEVK